VAQSDENNTAQDRPKITERSLQRWGRTWKGGGLLF